MTGIPTHPSPMPQRPALPPENQPPDDPIDAEPEADERAEHGEEIEALARELFVRLITSGRIKENVKIEKVCAAARGYAAAFVNSR